MVLSCNLFQFKPNTLSVHSAHINLIFDHFELLLKDVLLFL